MITDQLLNRNYYSSLNNKFSKAFDFIENNQLMNLQTGRIDIDGDNLFVLVNEYDTKENELNVLEAHRKYIDLQYIIEGTEVIEYENFDDQIITKEYCEKEDYILYSPKDSIKLKLSEGQFAIFFPQDLHLPSIAYKGMSDKIKKLVIKILIN